MSPRVAAVLNALLVVVMIAWNYWTAVVGFGGHTVGTMSNEYDTLFTPAGYAFAIWGFIFLGQIVHAGYQLKLAFGGDPTERDAFFAQLGPWLLITNVLNIAWTAVWLSEWTATSVLILLSMNVCLVLLMRRLRMEVWDAPMRTIAFVWWPIVIYAGWVAVAVLANLSAFLAKEGWVPGDSAAWAIAMLSVATLYNLMVVKRRNLREHALVAVWAFTAIAVKQRSGSEPVFAAAVAGAGVLFVVVVVHAYRNRATLPVVGKPGRTNGPQAT